MALTIEQALQQGVAAHNAGNLKEAERIYRAVLQTQPEHPSANHNLGLIAISANQIEAALSLFKTALNVNSNVEQFWISYIDALVRAQRPIDAKQAIKKAKKKGLDTKKLNTLLSQSKREPDNKMPSDAQLISLLELYQRGRFDDAEKLSISIIQKFPKHQFAWKVLGLVCKQTGRLIESLTAMKKSVELEPQDAEAHSNLGNTLKELGRLEDAGSSYKQAIMLKTGFSEAHQKLAITQRELGNIGRAIQSERYEIFLNSPNVEASELENLPDNLPFRQPSPLEYPALYRAGMGTENVGGFLRAMAQMLRPKNVLEIGAGYTTPFLLEALINNERVYDDGNLEPSYFKDYVYDSKLVVIDNMSLGELSKKPEMDNIISSKYIDFVEGNFEGKAGILGEKYGDFDFVWFDCGGIAEYQTFMDEYWSICSDYIFFHFTYSSGSPNELRDIILNNVTGNPSIFDIVEPHKSRQGSITMIRKK